MYFKVRGSKKMIHINDTVKEENKELVNDAKENCPTGAISIKEE